LLKPKFEYVPSFVATLLAYRGFRALICISAKVLAIKGSLVLLVPMLSASSNAKIAIVLRFKRLIAILGLLYKNQLKLTSFLLILNLISLLKILINFITLLCFSSCYSLASCLATKLITSSYFKACLGIRAFGALITIAS
jgi:hypothetical protein